MRTFTRWQIRRRRIKNFFHAIAGRDVFLRVEARCAHEQLGRPSGGWEICVDAMRPGALVYSLGVGNDISFDLALIERYGAQVHAFDPTPASVKWVARQPLDRHFSFHPLGVASEDGTITLYPPRKAGYVSFSIMGRPADHGEPIQVPVKRLGTIMAELGHHHIDILKMDIEGAEYEVIRDMLKSGILPTQVLIEFHHRFPGIALKSTRQAVAGLRRAGYRLFYVSPTALEYGFVRPTLTD